MKKLATMLSAAALGITMTLGAFAPAQAVPLPAPVASGQGVVDVQFNRGDEFQKRRWRGDGPRQWRGEGPRYWGGNNRAFHNGHRGYRDHRPGYRYYNGFWFPAGAFIAGAIISGAINNAAQPPRYHRGGGSAHVQWCYNRYRSYRDYDNTFQPYNGPRQQCYSPYS
jgi:hypothetical protein